MFKFTMDLLSDISVHALKSILINIDVTKLASAKFNPFEKSEKIENPKNMEKISNYF